MVPTQDPLTLIPLVVRIEHDQDAENPSEFDGTWKPYSFSRRHINYHDPESIGLTLEMDEEKGIPIASDPKLRNKLKCGLAFFLSYYEHGRGVWSLLDEGPRCRFDTARIAGLLVWEEPSRNLGAKTVEERAADARAFLETYNAWCNGDVYGYDISDAEGAVDGSCWGYYGDDENVAYMLQCIQDECGERPVIFKGDAAYLGDRYKGVTFDPELHEEPADEDDD